MPKAHWILLFAVACGGSQSPEPVPPASAAGAPATPGQPRPPASPLAADTLQTTAGGATFTAPARWTVEAEGSRVVLRAPEPDLTLAVVEVEAPSGDEAAAKAWAVIGREMKRSVRFAETHPGRHGWQERREILYDTSPNERLVVEARALKRDKTWTVLLTEGSEPSVEKRLAGLLLVGRSLRPKGYERETFAGKKAHPFDAARIGELTQFLERASKEAGVPGVGFGLVQDGKVVFAGGVGVREAGKPAKVDADTLFLIASNTKAMTTLLMATLVDEGKLTWETPVTQVYPGFKLGNQDTTKRTLVKHLICACTGLPRKDFQWILEYGRNTPKHVVDDLANIQPTTDFGETYQYSNNLAAAAGFIAASVAVPGKELGAAYDEAMKKRVFAPLGMKTTTFDMRKALRGNHASPHSEDVDGKILLATQDLNQAIVAMRPTGGAWSSPRELLKFVQLELDKGVLASGKRLVSEANLLERRKKQVAVAEDMHYGMGLMVDASNGLPVVLHGGSMLGYKSQMFWLPDHGIGGVILTNADSGQLLLRPTIRRVLELAFDGQPEAAEDVAAAAKERREWFAKERARVTVPPDPAAVKALAARYRHESLGEIVVTRKGTGLSFDFGEWASAVGTRKNPDGTLSFTTLDPGETDIPFVVGEKDGKRTLTVREYQHEYVFVEVK